MEVGGIFATKYPAKKKKLLLVHPSPLNFDETALVPFCTLSFLFDLNLCPSLSLFFKG